MSRPVRIITIITAVLAVLYAVALFIASNYLHLDRYKAEILTQLQTALGRQVKYTSGDVSLAFGPTFTFKNVVIKEKDDTTDFITANELTFRVPLLPLLRKKLVLRRIVLERPVISLSRDRGGVFNIDDLLRSKGGADHLAVRDVKIRKGTLSFRDGLAGVGVTTRLSDLDLTLSSLVRGRPAGIKLATKVADEDKPADLSLSGSVQFPASGSSPLETALNLKIHTKGLSAGRYWPYYQQHVPFRRIEGRLDTDSVFKGKLSAFALNGSFRINRLRFDYPQVFHAVLTPREVTATYALELTPRDLNITTISATVDGARVNGSCLLKDIHSGDLRIVAKATSSPLRLDQYKQYIPFGIIPKDTSEYIEQRITSGVYRLEDGSLDGRVSQITHMERGQNYNVLYIRARVDGGQVSYGPSVPLFNGIGGRLELKGKDFNLIGMSGSFGGSPFTLEGKIGDYPLDTPSYYQFAMTMQPADREVAWLLHQGNNPRFAYSGASTLHLSGNGPTSGYQLSGDWNLNQAAYTYPGVVAKPQGHASSISFSSVLTHEETRVTSLRYQLDGLTLTGTAAYRYSGDNPFSAVIHSNQIPVGDIAAMVPRLKPYAPHGKVQLNLLASGRPTADGLSLEGGAAFSGFSFKPSARMPVVSSLNGTVKFNGTSLETPQLDLRLGNSLLHGKGTLSGFSRPAVTVQFSSPELDVADLGLKPPPEGLKLKKVQAHLVFRDDTLQIRSLSTQLNRSHLTVKGAVTTAQAPRIDVSIASSYLDLADLMLLSRLDRAGGTTASGDKITLKAAISADAGRIGAIDFRKLQSTVQLDNSILYLQPLECQLLDGTLSARCRFDLGNGGAEPRYQTSFNLTNVSAQQLLQGLDEKRDTYTHGLVTGLLTIQGDVTAKGRNTAELKRSALGNMRLHLEDGSIRKFSVLSKIFSLLNISQLFKFQLPDMVSGGMPYNEINASFAVRDGIVSTSDLFIDSDAMNISAVGKVNMIRDEIDMTIGVKPLQTVDKVVSHLPVVGWLLTGRDKSLVTAYFEAKGSLKDPSVNAVPVKSLAKGVFDVFKRVFQLPVKLVTDTGEVIVNTK